MAWRRKIWWAAAAFWLAVGLLSGIQVWISMFTHGHSVPRLVGYYVLLWAPWIPWSVAIVGLARRRPVVPPRWPNLLIHLVAASAFALAHSTFWIALTVWMRPFDRMTGPYSRPEAVSFVLGQAPIALVMYGAVLAVVLGGDFYRRARQHEVQAAHLEAALMQARLRALELQLQPHFLFNTLNAVSALVRTGRPEQAVTMVAGLSDLLRYTLDRAGQVSVALEEESAMLALYLEIQRTRFPDRFSFGIDISPEVRRAAVPTLILQPLAENAIRHGIAHRAGGGQVLVKAFKAGGELRIEMFNSGALGSRPEGIGLRNTRDRLRQIYGDAQRFALASCDGGVVAALAIPCREAG